MFSSWILYSDRSSLWFQIRWIKSVFLGKCELLGRVEIFPCYLFDRWGGSSSDRLWRLCFAGWAWCVYPWLSDILSCWVRVCVADAVSISGRGWWGWWSRRWGFCSFYFCWWSVRASALCFSCVRVTFRFLFFGVAWLWVLTAWLWFFIWVGWVYSSGMPFLNKN